MRAWPHLLIRLLVLGLLCLPLHAWAVAQLINGDRTHAGATNYGVSTGTGTAYILTLNAAIPGYADGSCYLMQAHTANTGAATLNVNGQGARALKKQSSTGLVDLVANDIRAGDLVHACTDGTVMQVTFGGGGTVACAQLPAFTGDVTKAAGSCAQVLANIPTATPAAGSVLYTAIAAPATPAAGTASVYVDSTTKNLVVKDDAGVIKHGVQTAAVAANQYVTGIDDAGAVSKSTIASSNLSDNSAIIKTTGAQRMSDKQVNPREVVYTPSGGVVTLDLDTTDVAVINSLSAGVTFAAPVGTGGNPVPSHELEIRVFSATPQPVTWNAIFTDGYSVALPTTTTGDNVHWDRWKVTWNTVVSKWQLVARVPTPSGPTISTTGSVNLPVTGVKLPSSQPARLDNSGAVEPYLYFSATIRECASWPFALPVEYVGSPVVHLEYAMLSAGGSGGVAIDIDVMHQKTGAAVQTASFDTVNTCTSASVAANNLPNSLSCALTAVDTWAAGGAVVLRACRNFSHATDTAAGDLALYKAQLRYAR